MWVASATAMQQLLLINTISKGAANEMLCIKKKKNWFGLQAQTLSSKVIHVIFRGCNTLEFP